MHPIIFAGPSLGPAGGVASAGIDLRPPACCGDILRAVADRPDAIGLIDGLFETERSPWHKEILFAMSEGIAVFGAASMGALRAIELAPFGMVGVGKIFQAFCDGRLEDDDEVAVLHGPAELGYPNLTKAMVNIRASLDQACTANIVSVALLQELIRLAKRLFYKDRTWENIFAASAQQGTPTRTIIQLEAWLQSNEVDLKRQDALALVGVMLSKQALPIHGGSQGFYNTTYFNNLRCSGATTV
jgi:hypothetical protein